MPNVAHEQEGLLLDARLDRLPITKWHVLWISILGVTYFVEIFDNVVFSSLAPAFRKEWGLTLGQVGVVASSVYIGMLIGSVVGGRLSDRFGRRPALVAACIVFSLGSLGCSLAPSWELLLASRIITGIGVQAAVGVLMVIVSEMFPAANRGRFFTVLTFVGFAGIPITGLIALADRPDRAERLAVGLCHRRRRHPDRSSRAPLRPRNRTVAGGTQPA